MSSSPVTFNPRPLIWTTTYLSIHLFLEITGLLDCLGYWTKMAAPPPPPYMAKQNMFHYKL